MYNILLPNQTDERLSFLFPVGYKHQETAVLTPF